MKTTVVPNAIEAYEADGKKLYDYVELLDQRHKTWSKSKFSGKRYFRVAESQEVDFVRDVLGKTEVTNPDNVNKNTTEIQITRTVPMKFSTDFNAYAVEATVKEHSVGGFFEAVYYPDRVYSLVEVRFTKTTFTQGTSGDNTDLTLVTELFTPMTEFVTLNNTKLYWGDGVLLDANEAPGFLIKGAEWKYTIHQAPYIPYPYLNWQGLINSADMQSARYGLNFASGTVLYDGLRTIPVSSDSSNDNDAWDLEMTFLIKALPDEVGSFTKGWNWFPRAGSRSTALNPNTTVTFERIFNFVVQAPGELTGFTEPYSYQNLGLLLMS
jgi:hypothetical protein